MNAERKIYLGAIILLGAFLFFSIRSCNKNLQEKIQEEQLVSTLQSELEVVVNKNGEEIASREAIIINKEKEIRELSESDRFKSEEIDRLSRMTRRKRGKVRSAAVIKTETKASTATSSVISTDTAEAIVVTYNGEYSDRWVTWTAEATPDSFIVDLIVDNEYEFTQSHVNPWFKKPYTVAEVKNLNEYTRTKELYSFIVDEKVKRIGIGPYVGFSPTLSENLSIGAEFQLGVGVHYDVIQVK